MSPGVEEATLFSAYVLQLLLVVASPFGFNFSSLALFYGKGIFILCLLEVDPIYSEPLSSSGNRSLSLILLLLSAFVLSFSLSLLFDEVPLAAVDCC